MIILPTSMEYSAGPTSPPLARFDPMISAVGLSIVGPSLKLVRIQKVELLGAFDPALISILTVTEYLPGGRVIEVPVLRKPPVL